MRRGVGGGRRRTTEYAPCFRFEARKTVFFFNISLFPKKKLKKMGLGVPTDLFHVFGHGTLNVTFTCMCVREEKWRCLTY